MLIGQRLRELREAQNLSQGDIEKLSGLFRSYSSRVESGHTVPTINTLEKYANALQIPMYQLFYEGASPVKKPRLFGAENQKTLWGSRRKDMRELDQLRRALSRMNPRYQNLLLAAAKWLAGHAGR